MMKSKYDTTTQEYVEIIHEIQKSQKVARVKDIAQNRGVTRSSVSTALNLLKEKKLIKHESYGLVELTSKGEELARMLDRRHAIIQKFFTDVLGIQSEIADADACKMEHHVSSETMTCLIRFLAFIKEYPEMIEEYLKNFRNDALVQKDVSGD
ncbi:metal-dependent transcriptional regulator [candidate division KSB1 bacterium]|nr:metal-dependent transcriptional regulator [candidate division KSB1 bacterium]